MRVNVGTTVYRIHRLNIAIVCNIIVGAPPVTFSWYRNGEIDQSRGNVSTIIVTDATDNDEFTCRAEIMLGYADEESTVIRFANNTFCIHDP